MPNPYEVRNDFSRIIENLDSFIAFTSTQESVKFAEFHNRLHSINMEAIQIWHRINLLTVTDKKYQKAFEKMRKILIKLLVDCHDIERKHVGRGLLSWEYEFQKGKLRKDLVNHLDKISKQMKKIQKIL